MTSRRPLQLALGAALVLSAADAQAATIDITEDITVSETWTSDNEYVLTQVIYVTNGATLTIEPGTVVRGEGEESPGSNDPGTLVVTRGSKINAVGTKTAPIVFTDLFDDNVGTNVATFPYDTVENALALTGQWGGVILLGDAYVSFDTASGPDPLRENQIEGLTPDGGLGLYGGGGDDDDDSGTMSYVSIRYGGFNLSANNEINGLTLGAVGRATDLHHIEVFQNKDDGIEFFGGTASVKNVIIANVGDDGVDYDEGWRGKGQFIFQVQGTPGTDKGDKGGEHDGGLSPDASEPFAIPTIYNATYVGHGQKDFSSADRNTGLHIRDNAGGRYYNSFFADFGGATFLIEGDAASPGTSGERAVTDYVVDGAFFQEPDSEFELELQDNTFYCIGRQEDNGADLTLCTGDCTTFGGDSGKDHYDNSALSDPALGNEYVACADPLPIRELTRLLVPDATVPDPVGTIDPVPAVGSPLLITDRTPPADGFFEPGARYRGAFSPQCPPSEPDCPCYPKKLCGNWADGWSTLSRLGYFPAKPVVSVSSDISVSETWTADNEYVLESVIYVRDGATLTIEPGTVVRGEPESSPGANDPGSIVITRGSKIDAVGTPHHPIVFTDLFDDNIGPNPGTFPYDSVENALALTGQWGGVILLGDAYVSFDTASGPDPLRENQIEGLTPDEGLGLYGGGGDDDDDSGTMSYVSIRYGGFNLSANNEINGLTLGAVGRATDLHHIEVFQNKDDGIEFFGGTASVKNVIIANVGDDGVDYDEGWRGKGQFIFQVQGTPGTDKGDKGGEHDGGLSPDASEPFAIPTIYNATYVGHGQKDFSSADRNTGLHIRDNAGGRYYNSFFADFGGATFLIEGDAASPGTSGERAVIDYVVDGAFFLEPDSEFELELQDNTFYCIGRQEDNGADLTLCTGDCTTFGGDSGKDHYDNSALSDPTLGNEYVACADPLPIQTLDRLFVPDGTVPDPVGSIDPRPAAGSPLLTTDRQAPADGFFSRASYRGAFGAGDNWAAGWSTMARLGYFPTCDAVDAPDAVPNPARHLMRTGLSTVTFDFEAPLGDDVTGYDTLRSSDPADFASATCLESGDGDTTFTDADVPAVGQVFYYLIRGNNDCGEGSVGSESAGVARAAGICP